MDFHEFREKYKISQDSLHKLMLEVHEYAELEQADVEEWKKYCSAHPDEYGTDEDDWMDDFESPDRSFRDRCLKYLLRLIQEDAEDGE